MAVQGGTVSPCCILIIRKFIDFMSLFRLGCGLLFLLNNIPSKSLECATYG